ncbi:hypothetical protein KAR91_34410 [Candidatus Pacearchaeota archaeon]|nr:hypothetical protein [Candidatus Pacearchaeota archaeon]
MFIRDALTKMAARVNSEGYLRVSAATLGLAAHSGDKGDCYSVVIEVDSNAADGDFFYLKNNHATEYLRIYKIKAKTGTLDTEIQIITGVGGTPSGATDVVPVNALIGSGNVANCTCQTKASDMATSGGSLFDSLFIDKDLGRDETWIYEGEIALMPNQALAFNSVTDPTAVINMTIYMYFHEPVV